MQDSNVMSLQIRSPHRRYLVYCAVAATMIVLSAFGLKLLNKHNSDKLERYIALQLIHHGEIYRQFRVGGTIDSGFPLFEAELQLDAVRIDFLLRARTGTTYSKANLERAIAHLGKIYAQYPTRLRWATDSDVDLTLEEPILPAHFPVGARFTDLFGQAAFVTASEP